ncbi:glycerophosphodiester phosphodiesterase [Sulfurovum sp. zt1-1]|uniref:Glycerophosphodiester phosphodiesterase n=1 Tax=Sulfurovum zhangzhouensis TaxID=3019067 RepID=A0ABT7QV73_9BACT|nr:glycerophosphodiester phosphodiesterase [Sulfurovum zhangzhouensis]MDM5270739.1 glycerophosphodiester phosphodiesterase [Sulfurovum zhangzhouensis]
MIVAHRGASMDAPENTIPAFKLAWEQDADAIEGDFRLTKDGHIVCIHDADTKRVSDTKLVVRHATLAELRKLDVGIPTISEVLSTIPEQKMIYIEIKCGTEIIPALLEEIERSDLTKEQIVVISFHKEVIQALKNETPQYKAIWLSQFKKDISGKTSPSLETVLTTLKQIKADGFSSSIKFIDEAFIKRVKEEGYEYHVWTIDDAKSARLFNTWGVNSITTNRPGYLRKALTE